MLKQCLWINNEGEKFRHYLGSLDADYLQSLDDIMESEGIGIITVVEDKKKKSIAILYDNGEIYGAFTFKKPKPPTFLEYMLDDLKLFFKELIDGPQERYPPTSFE